MRSHIHRTQNVAAIQLRHRHKVERSDEQSHPRGAANRRQEQRAGRNPWMKSRIEKPQQERRSVNQFRIRWICKPGHQFGMEHTVNQRGDRKKETHDGSRGANVKQSAIGAHRRTN